MRTISDALTEWLIKSPFIEEAMSRDILNLSALARELRPGLEKQLMRDLSDSAVMMALNRMKESVSGKRSYLEKALRGVGKIAVRSGLGELTYRHSPSVYYCLKRLLESVEEDGDAFITLTQGVNEITLVLGEDVMDKAVRFFVRETLIQSLENLAAVSVRLDESVIFTPGIHYGLLKPLAWSGINVVEVVSTYSEFTIILEAAVVDRSFSILMNLLAPSR
ncbi:MAG TPA: hypothetical protein ENN40_03960 [Candidatus Aminicenantes bacterium]|nr:hypothetical protein [Candidatus Aminicenantes bacterium]